MIAAGEPESVTVPVPLPETVTPAVPPSVNRPFVAETVIEIVSPSMSVTVIALPLAVENTTVVSSLVVWPPGTAATTASLTGVTVTVTLAVSVTPPDVTV